MPGAHRNLLENACPNRRARELSARNAADVTALEKAATADDRLEDRQLWGTVGASIITV